MKNYWKFKKIHKKQVKIGKKKLEKIDEIRQKSEKNLKNAWKIRIKSA